MNAKEQRSQSAEEHSLSHQAETGHYLTRRLNTKRKGLNHLS